MRKRKSLPGYGRIKVAELIRWLRLLPPGIELPIKPLTGEVVSLVRVYGESIDQISHIKTALAKTKVAAILRD